MDKFACAHNTVVAFYPKIFRGVVYISAGKAAANVCRQVDELILVGYSVCINRGKITNR